MREGYEYIVGEGWIELQLREAFIKYFSWCKRKGFPPLYANTDSFISAMSKHPAVMDKVCFDSKIRKGGASRVHRFSLEGLSAEGVEQFKSKFLA